MVNIVHTLLLYTFDIYVQGFYICFGQDYWVLGKEGRSIYSLGTQCPFQYIFEACIAIYMVHHGMTTLTLLIGDDVQ